jgi:hypothetical protein
MNHTPRIFTVVGWCWLLALAVITPVLHADVKSFVPKGFSMSQQVEYATSPDTLFDLMTGDISPWWDHHMSEHPVRLVIEPRPGGAFLEQFDAAGSGVHHAVVTAAERGKLLRMEGPLGLAGTALLCVWTWEYTATPTGTKLTFTGNLTGQLDDGMEQVIAQVWNHFLVEQLKPYVDGGSWRKR